MDTLTTFNRKVEKAVETRNGNALRDLLCMSSEEATKAMEVYVLDGGAMPSRLDAPWDTLPELVETRFAASSALNASNWVEACSYLAQSLTVYIAILSSDDSWSLPLLNSMCTDLRTLAVEADNQLRAEGSKPCKLEEIERVLKRAFTAINNDRRALNEGSKRVATLGVINHLLKVYFALNNLRLCNNVTRAVNAPGFPNFEDTFPVSHRVTYKYFSGRLHLYDDRCAEAVEDLTYAFTHTPERYERQKRLELLYLVPARILTGVLPSQALLQRFNIKCFVEIVKAIKSGNLRQFEDAVEQHEEFFIRKALYLAVQKMRPLVYRSLCKKVFTVLKSNKIKIDAFRTSLHVCGVELERDEVECILANLIYNNYVKGYISHKIGYIVLSKKNAFPKLSQ